MEIAGCSVNAGCGERSAESKKKLTKEAFKKLKYNKKLKLKLKKLFKGPKQFELPVNPWGIRAFSASCMV